MPQSQPIITISIPFSLLPEGRFWSVGKIYRVKMVLRQTGMTEDSATFEVHDATAMNKLDRARHEFLLGNRYGYNK